MKRFGALFSSLIFLLAPSFSPAAVVHVSTKLTGPASIEVGQTTSVSVVASVEGALSPNDGIFTFDLDAITNNLLLNSPQPLIFTSVTRPNVNDTLFTGSNGTPSASGMTSIYGGYFDQNRGIGTPTELFSATLQGIAPGTARVTAGPQTVPYGFDFVLYQTPTGETQVFYDAGITIDVTPGSAVPLPPACIAGLLGAFTCALNSRRRLRTRPRTSA
jgi:hypothetical protein